MKPHTEREVRELPTMASMLGKRSLSHDRDGVLYAQQRWAALPLRSRVAVIARLRSRIASQARSLAETIPVRLPGALHRTLADSLVAEVLPLLEACRFLEREAEELLRPRFLGAQGRPLWLGTVDARVDRLPWGVVLILAAANYPLLLAGVQALQALVAGNAVLWKPAPGTEAPAHALRQLMLESGLPAELCIVLDSSIGAATDAIAAGVDYAVLTGSAQTGVAVAAQLAQTLTPSAMELSGSDAVFLLPDADLDHAQRALLFGLRLNGSATCMAPRRLFLVGWSDTDASTFESRLRAAIALLPPVPIAAREKDRLQELLRDARDQRAEILLDGFHNAPEETVGPTLITAATPALLAMQSDIFVPLLSVMRVADGEEAIAANAACPYALTASVFGPEREARRLAAQLRVGNVLINDLIAPTADPRIPFGGRSRSGYGVTRGAEGLLAMTTPRTTQIQRGRPRRVYEPTNEAHADLFEGLAQLIHSRGVAARWRGLQRLVKAAKQMRP